MSSVRSQQWKQYNPLDKRIVNHKLQSSNTLPFSKKEIDIQEMVKTKTSTIGVYPARSSSNVEELNVMMVGDSLQKNKTDRTKSILEDSEQWLNDPLNVAKQIGSENIKMPAILATEGTATQAVFAKRAKPPSVPRSKLKRRKRKIIAPPNSKTGSRHGKEYNNEQQEVLYANSPIVAIDAPSDTESPQRSINDMIQSLRSSRHASGKQRSQSDIKIDQLLQQVMAHADEWVNEKNDWNASEGPTPAEEDVKMPVDEFADGPLDLSDSPAASTNKVKVTIEVDVSDTVSTLASQISAPAGIPDVSSILMRKSSHGLHGASSMSETSSPVAMFYDEDEAFDHDQAVQDASLSLDVRNHDVLNVQGGFPALLEKAAKPKLRGDVHAETVSQQEFPPYLPKGRIHRLCLLPSIGELEVSPMEFALTKVLHANPGGADVMFGDAPAISKRIQNPNQKQAASHDRPTVKPQVSKNKNKLDHLDSSKLDPLDIDGWKKLVEGEFERQDDYTLQGVKTQANDWGLWRLLWTVAPPKMSLTTTAVKALVFPDYHGTVATQDEEPEDESWQGDDDLSDIQVEDEQKREFNPITLLKRHKSFEALDITRLSRTLKRSRSTPNVHFAVFNETEALVKTSYTDAMAEVRQQKELAYMERNKDRSATTLLQLSNETIPSDTNKSSPRKAEREPSHERVIRPPTGGVMPVESSTMALTGQGIGTGRSYVMYPKKKLKAKRSKRFVQNVRKQLQNYKPARLKRSSSLLDCRKNSITKKESTHGVLPKKLVRSTSVPRLTNFNWFISRHQVYPERINDVREWVRDIWNSWFDELFPPPSDDDSSFSDDEQILNERGDAAVVDKRESHTKTESKKLVVPDKLPPAIVGTDAENMVETEESMKKEVVTLTMEINRLLKSDTSRRACHLARRGTLLRKLGNIKEAVDDLTEAISIQPRLTQAYWQRHLIYLLKNQQHDALDDLNALLKINRKDVDGYRSRGDVFASLGDYTMAVVNYTQTIKLAPESEEPYFQRASIFEKTGDMLLAMEDYATVVRLNPLRTDALLKRAVFHFERKSWHTAVTEFSQLIAKDPQNAQARTYRGRAHAELRHHENALIDLSAAVHLDPCNAHAYYFRGALLRTAAPTKALQDLSVSLLIDDSEKNVLALLHRGILYSELKKYQDAMSDFEQSLRLDHTLACAHVNIGLIQLQVTENFWEAGRQFSLAIKGDPTYIRSYVCRSDALARTHEYEKALRDITRAIHLQPTGRHLYLRRGKLLLQLKKLKLAAFCVRHIATLDKSLVSTSATQQAVVQSFLGNHTAAVDSLSAACRTKPVPHMYVLLSKALIKGKRFKEAITNLKNALELSTLYAYGDVSLKSNQAPTAETAEMHFLLGQCYTEMTDHSQALHSYNEALRVNQNFAEAYYQRGLCRLKLDHSKGVQDLNRALALNPKLFEAYLSRAAFYCTKKRYSKAILNCNEALRLRPMSVRALLCRGALKFRISAFHHAITDLSMAIALDKQCTLAYYNRAVCLHKMKRYEDALKDYSIILILSMSEADGASRALRMRVFVNRALLYLDSGFRDARNAALDLGEASRLSPNDTRILHTMALCYHKLHDLSEAEAAYTKCLEVDPYIIAAYVGRGDVYNDAGRLKEAKVEYEKALRLDPANVDARVHLGYNLQIHGHLQLAWMQFTSAINLDPNCQAALEGRAVTCLHASNLDAAARDLSVALKCGPPTARLLTACGVVHQCQHDLHSAMAFYNKAKTLDPTYSPAHFNATVLYLRERRFVEARSSLDTVIDQDGDDSPAYLNRAIANVFLGNVEEALQDFKLAIELDPHNGHVYYNRGNLFCMLKRYEEAEIDFNNALDINPSDYVTLKRRADVRGCLGNKSDAVEDYKQSLIIYERVQKLSRLRRH